MSIKISLIILAVLIILPSVQGAMFWYDDEIDRENAIEYANKKSYDSVEPEDFDEFENYNCFSLQAYNGFADRKKYDKYQTLNADNIKEKDLQRLRRDDYNTIANQNKHDSIYPDEVESYDDTACWTLGDYNNFAETKKHDKFKPVYFTNFDDLETVYKIGTQRFHFFEPTDLMYFDLQKTEPQRYAQTYNDQYNWQNYNYYKRPVFYYIPYGAVDFRTIEYD